jgi:hypothetical protein
VCEAARSGRQPVTLDIDGFESRAHRHYGLHGSTASHRTLNPDAPGSIPGQPTTSLPSDNRRVRRPLKPEAWGSNPPGSTTSPTATTARIHAVQGGPPAGSAVRFGHLRSDSAVRDEAHADVRRALNAEAGGSRPSVPTILSATCRAGRAPAKRAEPVRLRPPTPRGCALGRERGFEPRRLGSIPSAPSIPRRARGEQRGPYPRPAGSIPDVATTTGSKHCRKCPGLLPREVGLKPRRPHHFTRA